MHYKVENIKGEFPRDEMLSPDDVVDSILHTILAPNNVVIIFRL